MNLIFAIFFLMGLYAFTRNLFQLLFAMDNYRVHKMRQKQMRFSARGDDEQFVVDSITAPFIKHVLSHFMPPNQEALAMRLKMAKWTKFTPSTYLALNWMLKGLGVIAFVFLRNVSMFMAVLWAIPLLFGLPFLLKNSYSDRKSVLIKHFPDFIKVTEGYLNANIPFSDAVQHAARFLHPEWKQIANTFVINSNTRGIDEALERLKSETDIFEVKEFVSLVRLTIEQGGDTKDSFIEQADKVRDMYVDAMLAEIQKRKILMFAVHAPLLIAMLATFALPTVYSMLNLGGM